MNNQVTQKQIDDLNVIIQRLVSEGTLNSDAAGESLFEAILDAGLTNVDMNSMLQDLGNMTNIPVISDTRLKVEAWRKIIRALILGGIAVATIEHFIPGIYYTLYKTISTTITTLLAAGYTNDVITGFINKPSSAMPSMPSVPPLGLMNFLGQTLKTGFDMAASMVVRCLGMACDTTQTVTELLTKKNVELTAKLAAMIVLPEGIKNLIYILNGGSDEEIAQAIEAGVFMKFVGDVEDKVSDVIRIISEEVVRNAVVVNNAVVGVNWDNIPRDRELDVSVTEIINREIQKEIDKMIANPELTVSTTQLLNDILIVLRAPDKANAIEEFKRRYQDISPAMPRLLELLTAEPAQLKKGFTNYSQDVSSSGFIPGAAIQRKAASLGPYKFTPAFEGANQVRHEEKLSLSKPDIALGQQPTKTFNQITFTESEEPFVYNVLELPVISLRSGNIYSEYRTLMPDTQRKIFNFIKDNQTLDKGMKGYEDRVEKIAHIIITAINNNTVDSLKGRIVVGGRRHKKSRHYKKRRSTLRRRRVKGRRTRKGKKRRSTKRRR